ncbi:hypothetical protein [Streptomyces malaysiensis]|uniref:hypothetical protein n=1 Tax=Streptomyces malaysiensis TaxID=92644 RepID=UPI002B27E805|nr:hypothetical protein R8789_13335 [Streptomyces malaysiensis]
MTVQLGHGFASVRGALPDTPETCAVAARLPARGLGWAVRQESSLAVRHWWSAIAIAACASRRARRALLSAIVVDSTIALA